MDTDTGIMQRSSICFYLCGVDAAIGCFMGIEQVLSVETRGIAWPICVDLD